MLKGSERSNYIGYLKDNTKYTIDYLNGLEDFRLYKIYVRISQAIPQYINEILAKVSEPGYVGRKYTRYELTQYTYNELADLRRSLGIRKGKKKVAKVETASPKELKQAKEIVHQMSIEELYGNLFNSNETEEEKEHEHEEFLYEEEIKSAYDGEVPDSDTLKQKGIVNLGHEESRYRAILSRRIAIKKSIIQTIKTINQANPLLLKLSIKEIEALDFQELVEEYKKLENILPSIPSLDEMETRKKTR